MEHDSAKKEVLEKVTLSLHLRRDVIEILDSLKKEYGVQTRARVIELLLQDLLPSENQ